MQWKVFCNYLCGGVTGTPPPCVWACTCCLFARMFLVFRACVGDFASLPLGLHHYHRRCRFLALPSNQHITNVKRYCTQSRFMHGRMQEGTVVCLDFVSPWDCVVAPEVELVELMADLLLRFPLQKPVIRLSHSSIAEVCVPSALTGVGGSVLCSAGSLFCLIGANGSILGTNTCRNFL